MIGVLLLWSGLAGARPCALDVPADAPFELTAPERGAHVRLVIELWPRADQAPWVDGMLTALEQRGVPAVVVLDLPDEEQTDPRQLAIAARAATAGHEVAVRFDDAQVPLDAATSPAPMRRRLKPLRKAAGGIHTAVTPLPSRAAEAVLGRMGFRTLLQTRGAATAIPRPAVVFEGQPRIGAVLEAGPYAGPCGVKPQVDAFTPAAADRVTQTLWGAARIEGVPVVRMAIRGSAEVGDGPAVLGRWLDEVLAPAGIRPVTADTARLDVLAFFRTGRIMDTSPLEAGGGRLVSLDEVRAAAGALADENILPRTLPGDLNLTEAFLSFALLLAEQNEGEVVRLGALRGPDLFASSRVDGIVDLPPEDVVAIAKALVAELPEAIPAVLPVGARTLTAPELLTAMASVLRGDVPAHTWPTASPEPNAPGQGWGAATLP